MTDTETIKESDNSSEIGDQEVGIKIEELPNDIASPSAEELEIGIHLFYILMYSDNY